MRSALTRSKNGKASRKYKEVIRGSPTLTAGINVALDQRCVKNRET